MSLIEIAAPDLSWLDDVHQPEMLIGERAVPRPFTLPAGELRSLDGKTAYVVEDDFGVACGAGADVAVRGRFPGVIASPTPDVLAWAAETFFVTAGLGLVQVMTLDALARLADMPNPTIVRCPVCRGKLRAPDAPVLTGAHATLADGRGCPSALACPRCGGLGRVADFSDGFETITTPVGAFTVDRRALAPIVKHLRGDEVALCLAPAVGGLGFDVHLRPYVEQGGKKTVGGDWRIVWAPVPAADATINPPPPAA